MQRTSAILIGVAVLVFAAVLGFVLLPPPATPSASPSAQPSGAGAAGSLAPDLLGRRWNVLYVGTDHNAPREAAGEPVNTDAIMLVSLSADQSQLAMVSLPRDTVDVPMTDGDTHDGKVNEIYRRDGIDALVGAMEATFGVEIDGHVVLDMDDFATLVDAVGTIPVDPDEPLIDPIVDLDLSAGAQEIDARTTLSYVRTRVDQDYGRMARQQEVLQALVRKLVDPQATFELRPVLDGLPSLQTDLPLDQLSTLLELARRATDAEVHELVIGPPLITFEGDRGDGPGYVLEAHFEAIRSEVQHFMGE